MMNSIFYRSVSRPSVPLARESLRRILCIVYTINMYVVGTRRVGIKNILRTMSFLKSRLSPLLLSVLCSPGGGGCFLIGYYMYTLDSHSSSNFSARQRRPSPRYFYDIFSTLYRFFPPRPKVFPTPTPFFRYVQMV